jgi:UDP-N-acetylglucosamine diphosphorylase / glucose-1-phosphate thymidylyltransferase / UDP-N-acetylgalactosamine diphosphorylase / glucosamine-1-phosphate N-acetyltransferase / galactosamine-1-phosphate N-acetyltransferase
MKLTLRYFIDFAGLLHSADLPEDPFQLLGKGLESWLQKLLDSYHVGNIPLIKGSVDESAKLIGRVYVAEGAEVGPGVLIEGPAFIGPDSEVRHTAFIRGPVYVGRGCVVGHATEVKASCFFDEAKAGHLSYVGDSLLGRSTNLGAGTKLANVKIKKDEVGYIHPESKTKLKSGLRKFGSILGDRAQTGCNAVLSPGSILCRDTAVLPCVHFHGTLNEGFYRGK